MSAATWVNLQECPPENLVSYLKECKCRGYLILGLEQTDSSRSLSDLGGIMHSQCVLVLGKEKEGIPVEVLQEVDVCVEIPQVRRMANSIGCMYHTIFSTSLSCLLIVYTHDNNSPIYHPIATCHSLESFDLSMSTSARHSRYGNWRKEISSKCLYWEQQEIHDSSSLGSSVVEAVV